MEFFTKHMAGLLTVFISLSGSLTYAELLPNRHYREEGSYLWVRELSIVTETRTGNPLKYVYSLSAYDSDFKEKNHPSRIRVLLGSGLWVGAIASLSAAV